MLVYGCFCPYIGQRLDIARFSVAAVQAEAGIRGLGHGVGHMARKVRDATLDSKDARRKLKSRGKPYYRAIERGLHLGYRKLANGAAGTWVARHYVGDQSYQVEKIGIADDLSDADGVAVLDFWQAQTKARERMVGRVHAAAGKTGPLTVAAAMDAYLEFLESNRKSADDARYRDRAFIRPKLGELEVAALTA
jgi:hypothetical protein